MEEVIARVFFLQFTLESLYIYYYSINSRYLNLIVVYALFIYHVKELQYSNSV